MNRLAALSPFAERRIDSGCSRIDPGVPRNKAAFVKTRSRRGAVEAASRHIGGGRQQFFEANALIGGFGKDHIDTFREKGSGDPAVMAYGFHG